MGAKAKVLELNKKKRKPKVRIETVQAKHVYDCFRLLESSIRNTKSGIHLDEEEPDNVRHFMYNYILNENFFGLVAKIGRKPVGQVLGRVEYRPVGRPRKYFNIWNFYISPEFRNTGVALKLIKELKYNLRRNGIMFWEAFANEGLAESLDRKSRLLGTECKQVLIGGKV